MPDGTGKYPIRMLALDGVRQNVLKKLLYLNERFFYLSDR